MERQRRGRAERERRKNVPYADGSVDRGAHCAPKSQAGYDSRAQDAGRRTTEGHAERYNEKSQVNCQARRLRCCDLGRKTSKALQLEYETEIGFPAVRAPYDDDYSDEYARRAAAIDIHRMEKMAAAAVVKSATSSRQNY